jgi:hypothetical protein
LFTTTPFLIELYTTWICHNHELQQQYKQREHSSENNNKTNNNSSSTTLLLFCVLGGIFSDSTIHDLDMSAWLADSEPQSLFVQGHAFDPDIRALGDVDQAMVVIKYKNGVVSMIHNGRTAPYGYDQRLEVHI